MNKDKYDKLIDIAKQFDLKIIIDETLYNEGFEGRIFYKDKIIIIYYPALYLLAHELGHYLYYLRKKNKKDMPLTRIREYKAMLYGYGLLKKVGCEVDKQKWIEFNDLNEDIEEISGWDE